MDTALHGINVNGKDERGETTGRFIYVLRTFPRLLIVAFFTIHERRSTEVTCHMDDDGDSSQTCLGVTNSESIHRLKCSQYADSIY